MGVFRLLCNGLFCATDTCWHRFAGLMSGATNCLGPGHASAHHLKLQGVCLPGSMHALCLTCRSCLLLQAAPRHSNFDSKALCVCSLFNPQILSVAPRYPEALHVCARCSTRRSCLLHQSIQRHCVHWAACGCTKHSSPRKPCHS